MLHLRDKAVLCYLSISLPSQSKTDKSASHEVDVSKDAQPGSAKVTKRLFSKQSFGPLANAAQALRLTHYRLTLAWDDTGARILPLERCEEYLTRMTELREAFLTEAREFSDRLESTLIEEQARLGNLFRREDYPDHPLAQCQADWRWRPVPEGDFRECGWSEEVAEIVATKARDDMENGMVRSLSDAYSRIKEVVGKLAVKLADEDGIFRNSLVDNIHEVVDSVEGLNIFNDCGLSRTIQEARALLVSPDVLRKDKDVRASTQQQAAALMSSLQSLRL